MVKNIEWRGQVVELEIINNLGNRMFVRATLKKWEQTFSATSEEKMSPNKDQYEYQCLATDKALELLAKEIEEIASGRNFFKAAQERNMAFRLVEVLKNG